MARATCRNEDCPKPGRQFEAGNQQGVPPGYCTKKCAQTKAKSLGWTQARENKNGLTVEQTLRAAGVWGRQKKPKALDTVLTPLEPQGESQALVAYSPAAMGVVRKFDDVVLKFELVRPEDPHLLELLAVDPELPFSEAVQMPMDSDVDFQLADMTRIRLLDEADEIEGNRTSGTQPLNGVKNTWDGIFMPGVKGRRAAAAELARRMREREKRVAAELEAKRQAEEAQLQRDRDKVVQEAEREAQRRERLRDPTLVEDSLRREEELRVTATTMPTSLTPTSISRPVTGGSNRSNAWRGRRDSMVTVREALRSLLSLSEDWDLEEVVSFKQSGMNALAKNIKDTRDFPGFAFEEEGGFRRPKDR